MISIQPISAQHTGGLTEILNHDPGLRGMLNGKIITTEEFQSSNREWSIKHNAQLYAIVLDDYAIGTISLAHIDLENKTASCGYWLASAHCGKNYTSTAFRLVISEAKKMNLYYLTSKINKDNLASLAIWEKYLPEKIDLDKQWLLKISI